MKRKLRIKDVFTKETDWASTMMLGKDVCVDKKQDGSIVLSSGGNEVVVSVGPPIEKLEIEDAEVSTEYGVKYPSKAIRIYGHATACSVDIDIKLK